MFVEAVNESLDILWKRWKILFGNNNEYGEYLKFIAETVR